MLPDPLALFLPPVSAWFRQTLGEPTPVQRASWLSIAANQNTLLLATSAASRV